MSHSRSKEKGCDVLYLSPHLDDALFSCVGQILDDRRRSLRVEVATFFSRGSREHRERRAEDARATGLLGARCRWLGFTDAPQRSRRYATFTGIVFDRHPLDRRLLEEIRHSLRDLVKLLHPHRVMAPLAAGTHIDHRLLFDAVRAELVPRRDVRLVFYEDRPYSDVRGEVELRLAQVDATRRIRPGLLELWQRGLSRAPYAKAWLPPSEWEAVMERKRRSTLRADPGPPLHLRSLRRAWSPEEMNGAAEALCAYRSQLEPIFGEGGPAAALRAQNPWMERVWTPTPSRRSGS